MKSENWSDWVLVPLGTTSVSAMMLVAGFLAFGLMEIWFPRRAMRRTDNARWLANLILAACNFLLVAKIVPSGSAVAAALGLPSLDLAVRLASAPMAELLIGLLTIDALRYFIHRCFHLVPWLWRVHAVHHSDTEIDITTGYRHHPLEFCVAGTAFALGHALIGISPAAIAAYAAVYYLWTPFTHADLALPPGVERILRWVLVTPEFHAVHHVNTQTEGHSNYGTIFTVWDRLAATARSIDSDRIGLDFGLVGEHPPKPRGLFQLLQLPFQRLREPAGAVSRSPK